MDFIFKKSPVLRNNKLLFESQTNFGKPKVKTDNRRNVFVTLAAKTGTESVSG